MRGILLVFLLFCSGLRYAVSLQPAIKSLRLQRIFAAAKVRQSRMLKMVISEAVTKIKSPEIGGMFTNSSPDTKRVLPANLEGKTKFKIVYVVLESQYQSSLTKACSSINSGKERVAVEAVGYLLEELRNPHVYKQFEADVADANIFIGSLIFVQELADKVWGRIDLYLYVCCISFLQL